jgi:phosphoglycerate dehydrogenase-like enzyme
MKIVVTGHVRDKFLGELREEFPEIDFVPAATPEEEIEQVRDADALFGELSRESFLAAEKLKWVQILGTGVDRVTAIPELVESDVVLTNVRGPHANPMADHVFLFMLTLAHRGRDLWADQAAHRWDWRHYDNRFVELNEATMGILALGDIGRAVARRAHGFGMEVYAVDVRPFDPPAEVKAVWGLDRLDDLLQISDWFVVTAPLTPETRGLIDREKLGKLKAGGYVIVISRGGIVDEPALIDGLRSGRIRGAGLDVTAQEPLPPDNPLWDMENVLLTAHVSSVSDRLWRGRADGLKENLRRYLAGEPFLYVCDKGAGF